MPLIIPETLINGDPNDADEVMAIFEAIAAKFDANIGTGDLADDAVTQQKLATAVEDRIFNKAAVAGSFTGAYDDPAADVAYALAAATFRGGKVLLQHGGGWFDNISSGITQTAVIGIALDGVYVTEWQGGQVSNGASGNLGAFSTLLTVPAGVHTIGFMHRSSDGTGSTKLRGDSGRAIYATAVEL